MTPWPSSCPGESLLTDIDRLDADALLDVGRLWVVRDLVADHLGFAEGVDKGRLACNVTMAASMHSFTPEFSQSSLESKRGESGPRSNQKIAKAAQARTSTAGAHDHEAEGDTLLGSASTGGHCCATCSE